MGRHSKYMNTLKKEEREEERGCTETWFRGDRAERKERELSVEVGGITGSEWVGV